jgi:hypothetical protein
MSSVKDIFLDLAKADTNLKVANANGILAGPGVGNLTGDKTGLTGYVSENLSGNVTNMTGVISPLLYGAISDDNGWTASTPGMKGNITGLIGNITGVKNVNIPWQREGVAQPAQNLVGDITGLNGELAAITGHASKDLVSTSHIDHCWGDVTGLTGDLENIFGDVSKIYGTIFQLTGNVTDLSGNISGCTGGRGPYRGKSYYGSPHYYSTEVPAAARPSFIVGDVTNVTGKITVCDGQISENLYGHFTPQNESAGGIAGDISNLTGNISGIDNWVTGLWGEIKPKVTGDAYILAGDVSNITGQNNHKHFNQTTKEGLTTIDINIWNDNDAVFLRVFGQLPLETRKWYLGLDVTRQKKYLNFVESNYELRHAKGIHRLDMSNETDMNTFEVFTDENIVFTDSGVLNYILKPEDNTDVNSVINMWTTQLSEHTTDGTTYDTQYKKKIIIMLSTGDQKKLAGLNDVSKQNKFFENAGPTAAFWALSTAQRTNYIEKITV